MKQQQPFLKWGPKGLDFCYDKFIGILSCYKQVDAQAVGNNITDNRTAN